MERVMLHGLMERGKQTMKERDGDGRREGDAVIVGGQDGKWLPLRKRA